MRVGGACVCACVCVCVCVGVILKIIFKHVRHDTGIKTNVNANTCTSLFSSPLFLLIYFLLKYVEAQTVLYILRSFQLCKGCHIIILQFVHVTYTAHRLTAIGESPTRNFKLQWPVVQ